MHRDVADQAGADAERDADECADVSAELVLDDAAEQRARHDRDHGDADVPQETLHASAGLRVRSPARGAVGDDRPRQLADGDEQAEPEEHRRAVQLAAAIGAPTSRNATIAAHPISGAITSWRA